MAYNVDCFTPAVDLIYDFFFKMQAGEKQMLAASGA
jgi:hypothetical protein